MVASPARFEGDHAMDQTPVLGNSPPPGPAGHRDGAAEFREPPTGIALWPTFMRRTLTEEAVSRHPPALSARAAGSRRPHRAD